MPVKPPVHPDIRRQLKQRLLSLPPRAFELFAGDLLVYVGLKNVAVTRYIGDGGIDAHGDLIAESGFVRVPTGVQVKRHRHNVQRSDIDRFIGALGGQFHHGIFITTAGYAEQARVKATSEEGLTEINRWLDLIASAHYLRSEEYPTAWKLRSGLHSIDRPLFNHSEVTAAAVSSGKEPEEVGSQLCSLVQFIAFAHALLQRCCFVVITPTTESAGINILKTR